MKLEEIKDPKLRKRVEEAIAASEGLKSRVRIFCPDEIEIPKRKKKRIRQNPKPLMNKLEQEFYDTFKDKYHGNGLQIQCLRFRLANGLWYKPDFTFFPNQGMFPPLALEVKGPHAFRGGFENLKMAAHQYPWIKWILVWKENGSWQEQTVLP